MILLDPDLDPDPVAVVLFVVLLLVVLLLVALLQCCGAGAARSRPILLEPEPELP